MQIMFVSLVALAAGHLATSTPSDDEGADPAQDLVRVPIVAT